MIFELIFILSIIISWGIIPFLHKKIINKSVKDFVFEKTKSITISKINHNYNSFTSAMNIYLEKNEYYEKILRRTTWFYLKSLTKKDLEENVSDLFIEKGYDVWNSSPTGENGVDLYLEKEGKKFIVQCKTSENVLEPNSAVELYETLISHGSDGAYLASPLVFNSNTKEYCKNKPIKLLDIDELTTMMYEFESYTPYLLDFKKFMEDNLKK